MDETWLKIPIIAFNDLPSDDKKIIANLALMDYLKQASKDKAISGDPLTLGIVERNLSLLKFASFDANTASFYKPITDEAVAKANSANKSAIAKAKNTKPRAWVLDAWKNRTDKGQGKAAFSRVYAPLVKKEFDLNVTAETIARDWLPKEKPSP